jgi:hypothetical protein
VYLGKNHNAAKDCLDFRQFYDDWVPRYSAVLNGLQLNFADRNKMYDDFSHSLSQYLTDREGAKKFGVWGWKGPRSMYLLPFWAECFKGLKFMHVVRDGRDMAFSKNQNQMQLYADLLLPKHRYVDSVSTSFALWSKVNLAVAQFGESHLGANYLCVRYEDLINEPERSLIKISDFLSVDYNRVLSYSNQIRPNNEIGRWKRNKMSSLETLAVNDPSLSHFGYL